MVSGFGLEGTGEPYETLTIMFPSNVTCCLEIGNQNHLVSRAAGFYLNYLGWFRLIQYILPDALLL